MKKPPTIVIVAGPNGAGKTTFAREYLPNEGMLDEFINADLIAAGLSPIAPERVAIEAGKWMLRRMAQLMTEKKSFGFETTLSGLSFARQIPKWRALGYEVRIVFLSLPNVELAVERVTNRVRQGGHRIPEDVIRRRFLAGERNFKRVYMSIVNDWLLYDNSGPEPIILNSGVNP